MTHDGSSLAATSELVQSLKDKLTTTHNDDKLSLSADAVSPFDSNNRNSNNTDTASVSVPILVVSPPSMSQNESPVSVVGLKRRQPVYASIYTSARHRQQSSPHSPVSITSTSPSPPPLPRRLSTDSSNSLSSRSTAKRYRPPPPIPDEPAVLAVHAEKDSLSQTAAVARQSLSPAFRKSAPVTR